MFFFLLLQGSVDIGDHDIVAADAQLATDYQSVSSQNPPAKKARDKCAVSLLPCLLCNYSNEVCHKDV